MKGGREPCLQAGSGSRKPRHRRAAPQMHASAFNAMAKHKHVPEPWSKDPMFHKRDALAVLSSVKTPRLKNSSSRASGEAEKPPLCADRARRVPQRRR
eukprot:6202086-Pleurochrysis_carterae.AAC.1